MKLKQLICLLLAALLLGACGSLNNTESLWG